jgi:hypothetical protein
MAADNFIQHQEERENWVALIGRLILAFGDIENITYLALLQLPKDSIFESTSKLGLGARIDLILEILNGQEKLSNNLKASFSDKLLAAKKLAETRNIVSHSPLMLSIYQHPTEDWIHTELSLGNAKNKDKALTLEKLSAFTDQAEALAKDLYSLYGDIHKTVAQSA